MSSGRRSKSRLMVAVSRPLIRPQPVPGTHLFDSPSQVGDDSGVGFGCPRVGGNDREPRRPAPAPLAGGLSVREANTADLHDDFLKPESVSAFVGRRTKLQGRPAVMMVYSPPCIACEGRRTFLGARPPLSVELQLDLRPASLDLRLPQGRGRSPVGERL